MSDYGEVFTLRKKVVMHVRMLLTSISPKLNSCVNYMLVKKRYPNLNTPKGLDEKLLYLKLNVYSKEEAVKRCADKYEVRKYLEERGYSSLLNELYAVYDCVEDIEWEKLPNRFVVKWSFGSGLNVICDDKKNFDYKRAIKQLKVGGNIEYWKLYSEMQYKDTHKRIVVEKFLENNDGEFPVDYKVYCYNGKVKSIMVCVERKSGTPKFYFFDREWNLLRINRWGKCAPKNFTVPKPTTIDEMIEISEDLSSPFDFVRMDYYDSDGKIIFGEFTFSPSAGIDKSRLPSTDDLFGSWLKIRS